MSSTVRLGGFKVLKGMAGFSLLLPEVPHNLPASFFRSIAGKRINLPFVTCTCADHAWGLDITVDPGNGLRTSLLIEETPGRLYDRASDNSILSVFPHKNNPDIIGRLIEIFGRKEIRPEAMAHSPSAISVVLKEEYMYKAEAALFEPFSFSAYRTPDDWKLAQEGKEELYKEVVASYQERRPKVYGLEHHDDQALLQIKCSDRDMVPIGRAFKELARQGLHFTFFATAPCRNEGKKLFSFCLSLSQRNRYSEVLRAYLSDSNTETVSPVTVLSMNGPHFGDRYGIASELLTSFEAYRIGFLCVSCTIASVTCVVPFSQFDPAVFAIRECFDVPAVVKK